MCRYAAYLGPPLVLSQLIYKPPNSLVHQAKEAMQSSTRINADGFGVAWYSPEISPEPADLVVAANVLNDYHDALNGTDAANTGRVFPFSGGSRFSTLGSKWSVCVWETKTISGRGICSSV